MNVFVKTDARACTYTSSRWTAKREALKGKVTATLASHIVGHAYKGAPRPERANGKLGRKSPILSLKLGGL